MSTVFELALQINAMADKINTLEAEIGRLRRDLDSKNEALLAGNTGLLRLPPYIFVEHGNTTVVIARKAVNECISKHMFYNMMANALQLHFPKQSFWDNFRLPSMKILATFDRENENAPSSTNNDWHEIADWNESFMGVLAVATRLKVVLLSKDQ